ncbi:MAG: SAM-dependent methyltransferase [Alphaproteobacteria bacterium]
MIRHTASVNPAPPPTPLARLLAARIRETGPMSLADFMAEALFHPAHGYYTNAEIFGRAGDFTTAPEISQMFGELTGLWLAAQWLAQGARDAPQLIELGPGRGTLMDDMLRATRIVPEFQDKATVHLVEASPRLRDRQRETLAGHTGRLALHWHDSLSAIDEAAGPLFLIANEFFDALPIHQFELTPSGWRERMVGLTDSGDGFRFGLAPGESRFAPLLPPAEAARAGGGPTPVIAEFCPAAVTIGGDIARRIRNAGGAALIIDYGYAAPAFGDTLQAVRRHAFADPLATPGEADITAHVDFSRLASAAAAEGARALGPVGQGAFLDRLGLRERAEILAKSGDADVLAQADRLAAPGEMGTLFRALAILPPETAGPVAGFETP